ncbi:hypothetical protein IMZ48_39625 [Candidatus Bathyarchaeota archaeon]|nr:hypothetical protein [Candidatus Bathyarchaeota archaeon]
MADAHERFVSCLRWAPGIVKESGGGEEGSNGTPRKKAAGPEVQIRCVVATGGVDNKLRIWAN